ncbi:hypothetical protein BLX41_17115 [Pseudomonas protegens]|nr:hypothetical protein BLX41_17115 [Pseudomonas protegens]
MEVSEQVCGCYLCVDSAPRLIRQALARQKLQWAFRLWFSGAGFMSFGRLLPSGSSRHISRAVMDLDQADS